MVRKTSFVVIPAIVLAATASVHGQAPAGQGRGAAPAPPPAPMAIKQVKPGLRMVTGFGGNSTVRVTDQGVILVDTKNLGDGPFNDLVAQIKTVTAQPVKFVFVTHVHQDHAGNIGRFVKAGAQVITCEGLKKNLETGGADGKGYTSPAGKPDPPNATFSKDREVSLGKVKAKAYHFANAHTGGDAVVYFPDVKVIAFGDEFVAQPPNADYPNGGSVLTYPKALADALKLDWDVAIPGHGNDPMTRADVQAYQKKRESIAQKALELRKKGVAKEQIRQQIQAELPGIAPWMMTGLVNDMRLDGFYAELTNATR
ncbi:MAG: MBL fold metallo-hydrolase [Acidobacteria bacterium]|nr:MBL fold metallo-hydrolase [Acidobacteriota bacterium]